MRNSLHWLKSWLKSSRKSHVLWRTLTLDPWWIYPEGSCEWSFSLTLFSQSSSFSYLGLYPPLDFTKNVALCALRAFKQWDFQANEIEFKSNRARAQFEKKWALPQIDFKTIVIPLKIHCMNGRRARKTTFLREKEPLPESPRSVIGLLWKCTVKRWMCENDNISKKMSPAPKGLQKKCAPLKLHWKKGRYAWDATFICRTRAYVSLRVFKFFVVQNTSSMI